MSRPTLLAVRLLALGVLIATLLVLGPPLLGGLAALLHTLRVHWWLLLLCAAALWCLLGLRKKRR